MTPEDIEMARAQLEEIAGMYGKIVLCIMKLNARMNSEELECIMTHYSEDFISAMESLHEFNDIYPETAL